MEGTKKEERTVLGHNESKQKISQFYFALIRSMGFDDSKVAKELMVDEKEIRKLKSSLDSEISVELLFRLYYMSSQTAENSCFETYVHYCAKDLKKACKEEIFKRKES